MLRLTIQCGMDSTTFPIYINGTWLRNISLSFIPEFYKYDVPDDKQARWFTTEIKSVAKRDCSLIISSCAGPS